jgi:hypothetical protein
MDTVTAFQANYGADGFDLALLVAAMFCALVLCAFSVGHLIAAIAQRTAGARVARVLREWVVNA